MSIYGVGEENAEEVDQVRVEAERGSEAALGIPPNSDEGQPLDPGSRRSSVKGVAPKCADPSETSKGSPGNSLPDSMKKSTRNNSTSVIPIWPLCIILVVVAAYLIQACCYDSTSSLIIRVTKPKGMSWEEAQNKFQSDFREIRRKLNNQTLETYIQISSSILSTLDNEEPRQPSPLVFLTPPTLQNEFGSCLAREIGQGVNQIFQNVSNLKSTPKVLELGPEYFNDETISISDIHEKLIQYLKEGKFVIINNPQEVKEKERIMTFHAFCDNSAAPEKRATFIFVIPVPESIYERYDWIADNGVKIADKILDSSWLTVDPDKRPATITRVAASAVLLNPGDSC